MNVFKKILENFRLPDPKGSEKIFKLENWYTAWDLTYKKESQNIQSNVMKILVENLSNRYIGRDVVVDGKFITNITKIDYQLPAHVILSGSDLTGKNIQVTFPLNERNRGQIFSVDEFSQFFDENYKNKILRFTGCRAESDAMAQITRKIVDMGFYRNNIICLKSDAGFLYRFSFQHPFNIMDDKLGEIDPYFEEIWD